MDDLDLEKKLFCQTTPIGPVSGCLLWLAGYVFSVFTLFVVSIFLWGLDLRPTVWRELWEGLFVFGTPSLVAIWYWAGRWRQWVAATRERSGRCVACGYDLRATPDQCPECGRRIRDEAAR